MSWGVDISEFQADPAAETRAYTMKNVFAPKSKGNSDDSHLEFVTDWRRIGWKYVTGWLIVDLTASLPMDLLLLMTDCQSADTAAKGDASFMSSLNNLLRGGMVLKLLRFVRISKLFKAERLRRMMQTFSDRLNLNPGRIRLIRFILFVLMLMHWNACFFKIIGNMSLQSAGATWLEVAECVLLL